MLKDLTPDQTRLAQLMSELSEKAYYAGWMSGLEYALWQVVLGQRADYGQSTFNSQDVSKLLRLSEACRGWIVFDDETEETWVPLAEWKRRFASWQTCRAAKRIDG